MNKLLVLAGLLLCSAPVLAQSHKKATPAATLEGKVAVPVSPTLPGEESLTARERVERDMLMPTRRGRAAALQAAEDVGETPGLHNPANDAATEAAPTVKAATSARRTTYHRRATTHRRSTTHRTTTTKKKTAAKTTVRKAAVKKAPAKKRHH